MMRQEPEVEQTAQRLAGHRAVPELGWTSALVDRDPEQVQSVLSEITDYVGIEQAIHEALRKTGRTYYAEFPAPLELYAIVRILRPLEVVESGVSSGVSSAQLLLGLSRNQVGKLHSVDYSIVQRKATKSQSKTSWSLPPGRKFGWAVPDGLKGDWDLRIGRCKDILPRLVGELSSIDLFARDSPNGAANLAFELKTITPKLHSGSVVVADITDWNEKAFNRLANSFHAKVLHRGGSGLVGFKVP